MSFFSHSDNSGLVYTPRQHVVVFSYKWSNFSLHPPKYHDLKEVYAFEFSEHVQFRRQNGTLPRAKFLRVNQRQKKKQPRLLQKKVVKGLPGTKYSKNKTKQEVSKKGKYQGKFI